MKTLALIVTLILHVTGLWAHTSLTARTTLTAAGTGQPITSHQEIPIKPIPIGPLPVRAGTESLNLTAASALAVDARTSTVLYAQNPDERRPIASVTKLVTAIVILSRHSAAEPVTIPPLPTYGPDDERLGLTAGETYRLGDLISAALIQSANDAADALALADAGSTARFAAEMNAKMNEWGVADTHFTNPTGLSDTGNYATATALAKIATLALANPTIRQTISRQTATITSTAGRSFDLQATNKLLATGQFYGIKTGYTLQAGECFVGLTRIQGHDVITIVLGADDRFGATQTLTNWIGRNWQWL